MQYTRQTIIALVLFTILGGIGAVAYAVFTSTSHRASTLYPNVKYGSRCGPALAGSTRVDESGAPVDSLTIEQTETAPNIWTPSTTPVYYMGATEGCRFDCTVGYERDGASCPASAGVSHNETGGTITISNGTTTYVIADKNVGATEASATYSVASAGKKFQWGNNYGWMDNETPTTSDARVWATGHNGSSNPYSSGTWIRDYRRDSSDNRNLRGGIGDHNEEDRDTDNERSERQWPCEDGFHIPSQGEWNGLLRARWSIKSGDFWDNVYFYSDDYGSSYADGDNIGTQRAEDFLLPLAGLRSYLSASVSDGGSYAYYWSSSPYVNPRNARYIGFIPSNVNVTSSDDRGNGFPVRCFQNSLQ